MSLIAISDRSITYQCLSTDISGSKVPNASFIGASLYVADWDRWFKVLSDLSLSPLNYHNVDDTTGATIIVDNAHHEAHEGYAFTYHDVVTLGSGSYIEYLIITPNTSRWTHFGYELEGIGPLTIELMESSGSRSGSTIQTAYNRNRNSTNISPGTLLYKITSGSDTTGSRIFWWSGGVANNKTTNGINVGSRSEVILKQNTNYMIRITSGMATNITSLVLDWYEHISKFT